MVAYWEIAAHSAYDMFSKYSYLNVNLVLSHLGIWSVNFFLITAFSDHCLLVHFDLRSKEISITNLVDIEETLCLQEIL